ncbi:hypothetical protein D3C81_1756370 [compost metagenome]
MVIAPGWMLPVPIAPIMLSPPPLDTSACGLMPKCWAISGKIVPTAAWASISSGNAFARRPLGSISRSSCKSH